MQRSALFALVSLTGSVLPASSQSSLDYPKTTDEALARISDEERERVAVLRERILETTAKLDETAMEDYLSKIPKTGVPYDMVAIRGGEFLMGSPPDEAKRDRNEGPQVRVRVSPFWMGRYETTWNQYEPFMYSGVPRYRDGTLRYPEHLKNPSPATSFLHRPLPTPR